MGLNPDLSTIDNVHNELRKELKDAMRMAMDSSSALTEMQRKAAVQETTSNYLQEGRIEEANRYLEYMEQNFSY